jgi:HEAT repeat protein
MRIQFTCTLLFVCLLGTAARGAEDAATLLKVIQSNEASEVDRANAFQKIGDLAGEEAVAPLAAFLGDKQWSHYARFALQKMDGPQVTQALLKSLETLQGDLRLGVIGTIGRRRDATAVGPLAKLLTDADATIAEAAAVALGWIGTNDAAEALTKAFNEQQDAERKESLGAALLLAGQQLVKSGNTQAAISVFDLLRIAELSEACRIGATQNAILARGAEGVDLMVEQLVSSDPKRFQTGLAVSRVLPGQQVTNGLMKVLERESSTDRQVRLIQAMKDRGDRAALKQVTAKLKSDSQAVRLAAIAALGTLGDESSVPILISISDDATADAVLGALVALQGNNVNTTLLKAAQPPEISVMAVQALGKRRAKDAIDLFFQLCDSDAAAVRREAIVALGLTVPQDRFAELLGLLKTAEDGASKSAVQQAIYGAVFRSTQPDACAEALGTMIPAASEADREFLFEQMRIAGGTKAVALMRRFATGSDTDLQDASTKTLGRWLSADAAPVLLEVAQGEGKFANRALGGYIRIFRQFELQESERVAMAAQALKVATRPRERNAAIDAMTRFPCVGTFELALDQLDVPGSEAAAAKAALTIGRTVLDLDPAKGKAGLQKLIDANISPSVTNAAKALLQ